MSGRNRKKRSLDIYDKALNLFLKEGYDKTPMSKIAQAMGISKAGIYYYCSSKENLLFLIHKNYLEYHFIPLIEKAEETADPRERLSSFIYGYIKLFTRSPAPRVLFHEVHHLSEKHYGEIKAIWKRGYDIVRQAIKELQKKGEAQDIRDSFAAFLAIGMCSWTYQWFDYSRPFTADELADATVELFFKGFDKQ